LKNSDLKENLLEYPLIKESKTLLPYLFAKQKLALPLEEKLEGVLVALLAPLDLTLVGEIELFLEKKVLPFFSTKEAIEQALEFCYRQKEKTAEIFLSYEKEKTAVVEEEGYDLLDNASKNPTVHMLNAIIIEAVQQGASDIHFEPARQGVRVRYRIDGVLQSRSAPPAEYATQLMTRLKVMAKLDIAERRLPQDGRIKLYMAGREIDFRLSSIPVVYGERIVLRILDRSSLIVGLEKLGMGRPLLENFRRLLGLPEGIVLVTGPTGSGKTTTLYSAILELNALELNIMTIEDPVEYKLDTIAQMHVNPKIKLTFASGLRHILRQDPDVILIGEIRDKETAEIAIQAALTGHLVFSTLHTNDAPSALTRLADMGVEPYLLSSSIAGILAQRLVRKICPHCKEAYSPKKEEMRSLGLEGAFKLYRGKGCEKCFFSGYKGRQALFELMPLSSKIRKQLMKTVEAEALKKIALEEKMIDLMQSAKELVGKGETSVTEIFRAIKGVE
jgi:general secretion pathway protein E